MEWRRQRGCKQSAGHCWQATGDATRDANVATKADGRRGEEKGEERVHRGR